MEGSNKGDYLDIQRRIDVQKQEKTTNYLKPYYEIHNIMSLYGLTKSQSMSRMKCVGAFRINNRLCCLQYKFHSVYGLPKLVKKE